MNPKTIPLFDRNRDHPPVPTWRPPERCAQTPSRDAACGTGEAGAKRPRRCRAQRYAYQPGTPSPLAIGGVTAPPKMLDHWWGVPPPQAERSPSQEPWPE